MSKPPSKTCGAQYILKDCQCLTDPFDRYSTICGYIDKVDGLVYGCDDGCCFEKCDNKNKIPKSLETRPSAGVSLPPGYGNNLPTSTEPTPVGAPFVQVRPAEPTPAWKISFIAIVPLILVLILSCFL